SSGASESWSDMWLRTLRGPFHSYCTGSTGRLKPHRIACRYHNMLRARFFRMKIFHPAPLRKRLWQGAIALACLVLTIATMNRFVARDKALTPQMMGNDFLPFYMAGTFVRDGRIDALYDLDAVKDAQFQIASRAGLEQKVGPYWNPRCYECMF